MKLFLFRFLAMVSAMFIGTGISHKMWWFACLAASGYMVFIILFEDQVKLRTRREMVKEIRDRYMSKEEYVEWKSTKQNYKRP